MNDAGLRSNWHGRPERDYVPPGGMRHDAEDQPAAPRPYIGQVVSGPVVSPPEPVAAAPIAAAPQRRVRKAAATQADSAQLNRVRCPACGGTLQCCDSRPRDGFRWRRFKCTECDARQSTVEVALPSDFNSKGSAAAADSRVQLHFVRQAPSAVLLQELARRSKEALNDSN